ncbi:MAG TPA: FMN-binding protein [Acidimicrobiales bacterium]|nr:FMN-binding protein [Acidimicrobiales bacterium]
MRHAPLVIAATIAGLAGVLSFHTGTAKVTLRVPAPVAAPPGPTPSTSVPAKKSGPSTGPSAARTAVGAAVNYNYGVLSVSATVSGTTLTNVAIASINDGGNFRSQSIDQQSIPLLEQQARQAQSANIQGVSGASYTSAGFEQSLQSALTKLGFK